MIAEQEKRWVWFYAIVIMGLTSIPYLLGFVLQGANWQFTGFFYGVEDGNSYIAKMLSGAAGEWVFRTPYTAFPQNGMIAFLPYILLGKLTSPPAQHEQLLALFQFFRWVGGIACIWASYRFIAFFIDEVNLRRLGVVVATIGGGFGWLFAFGLQSLWHSQLPLEFYSPETFGFLSILGLPHLASARALLLWGLALYLENGVNSRNSLGRMIAPGFIWLLAGFFQPLTVVTGWIVLFFHLLALWIWKGKTEKSNQGCWRECKCVFYQACLIVVISAPIVVYNLVSFATDPYLSLWSSQNLILSPPIGDYPLAFGMLLPFVVFLLFNRNFSVSLRSLVLIGWLAAFPLMAYAPLNLQRRLPDGIWVVLVILALMGLSQIRIRRILIMSKYWLSLSVLSSLIFLVGGSFSLTQAQAPVYRPIGEVQLFQYIQEVLPVNTIVLAQYSSANPLPAWAPVRTVIGHGPESAHLKDIQPKVDRFYNNEFSVDEEIGFLKEYGVKYVVITPQESQFEFRKYVDLGLFEMIYNHSGYILLKIN